jgi:hypothetical protein
MTKRVVFLTYAVPMALLLISVAAFLLYVPLMTAAVVGAMVVVLVLSFLLGMAAGGRRIRISRMTRRPLPDRHLPNNAIHQS